MRTSPLERFIIVLAVAYPLAVAVSAVALFTSDAKFEHHPPSAWRAAPHLQRGLMAQDLVRRRELLGRTRAEIEAELGDPTDIREAGDGLTLLVYDAGPDGISGRRSLTLTVDPAGRVIRAQD